MDIRSEVQPFPLESVNEARIEIKAGKIYGARILKIKDTGGEP